MPSPAEVRSHTRPECTVSCRDVTNRQLCFPGVLTPAPAKQGSGRPDDIYFKQRSKLYDLSAAGTGQVKRETTVNLLYALAVNHE